MNELHRPNLPHSRIEHMKKRIEELKKTNVCVIENHKNCVLYNYFYLNILI